MTIYRVNALTDVGKAEILWELGVYLMARQERDHWFALYQIDALYVKDGIMQMDIKL